MEKLKLATAKENERIEKQKGLIDEQLREVIIFILKSCFQSVQSRENLPCLTK